MTVDKLMEPRFKVIAAYPNSKWNIGRILSPVNEGSEIFDSVDAPCSTPVMNPEKYPAVFKKLEWWEERSTEDMPNYLKRISGIEKVFNWRESYGEIKYDFWTSWNDTKGKRRKIKIGDCSVKGSEPATEQEYKDYIKATKELPK